MTNAQLKVACIQTHTEFCYEYRAFRKKCVTQGIVTFSRDNDLSYYVVRYRGRYVTMLFGDTEDSSKLCAAWNAIKISEETIEKIEGVKHESN